jgi:hypothetical protein
MQEAIEGSIAAPDEAVEINSMAQEANYLIGKFVEPVIPGFIANGGMSRMLNAFGYDLFRLGNGKEFDRLVQGTAVANGMAENKVRSLFRKMTRLLNSDNPNAAAMYHLNQEFIRKMPKAITHIWTGGKRFGHWEPILHAELFDYFNYGIRRAAMLRAFRESYPVTPPKQLKVGRFKNNMRSDIDTLKEAAGSKWSGLINSLYRTLQGHPSENYMQTGVRIPVSILEPGGVLYRMLRPVGSVVKAAWLTKQIALQPGELMSGGSVIFFGLRRSAAATLRHRELYPALEANGVVDRIIYNNAWNRNSKIRSAFRIFVNTTQKYTGQNLFNEMQEAQAGGAAYLLAEKIHQSSIPNSGVELTWSERNIVPQAIRAMGFSQNEVNKMYAGDPILLGQMVRKSASFISGGHAHPSESSRLLANRDFQKLFWFQKYPATRTNQLMKIMGLVFEHRRNHDYKQMAKATLLLARFAGFAANQGMLQTMMVAAFTGGLFAVGIRFREWEDEPFAMLLDFFRSAVSGPLQLTTMGWQQGGFKGVANNISRQSAPFNIAKEMWEVGEGSGMYSDLDLHDRIAAYLKRSIPMSRAASSAVAMFGLSEYDYKLDESIRALRRWQFAKWPRIVGTPDEWKDDERKRFRIQMKKAVNAMRDGDIEAYLGALSEAVREKVIQGATSPEAADSIRASLRQRTILRNPNTREELTPEELDELEAHIGSTAMSKLQDFDLMIRRAAGE